MQVIATAGHVDHGKSSLIAALTDIDPDRLAEEKRRGLTIDLGYAWCTLPSGEEVGFVDVPGHERFVHTMLAGVGPVRLVLFVVAADEGWSRQSEEHLAIIDLLGIDGAIIALTKTDAADADMLALAADDIRQHITGTVLEGAPMAPVSSRTGEGLDELREALASLVESAPTPRDTGLPRLFIDRVFTIDGAGTVVTGTLTGGSLHTGDEVELLPRGTRARIRALQSHKRDLDTVAPVARVAANLAGLARDDVERGEVLTLPGVGRPTSTFDASVSAVRDLGHDLTDRGAFTVHVGAAERVAKVRLIGDGRFARVRLAHPIAALPGDRFILRESGRRETVAGGTILDIDPPTRAGADAIERLTARADTEAAQLATLLVHERRAIRSGDVPALTGTNTLPTTPRVGDWFVTDELLHSLDETVHRTLVLHHEEQPMSPGAPITFLREAMVDALRRAHAPSDLALSDALLDDAITRGVAQRDGDTVSSIGRGEPSGEQDPRVSAVIQSVSDGEPTPPSLKELAAAHGRDIVDAAIRTGQMVRVAPDLVFTQAFLDRAQESMRSIDGDITVSAFRDAIGTSRKYAVPLLEYFDKRNITRREGDRRILRTSNH